VIDSTWTTDLTPDVAEFLSEFERRGRPTEHDDGALFHTSFIAADPNQASTVTRDLFVQSLPVRRTMFAKARVGVAHLVRAAQLDLDARYVLVRSEWDAEREGSEPIRLESTFLVMRGDDGLTVLAYLNHRDIAAILAELAARSAR